MKIGRLNELTGSSFTSHCNNGYCNCQKEGTFLNTQNTCTSMNSEATVPLVGHGIRIISSPSSAISSDLALEKSTYHIPFIQCVRTDLRHYLRNLGQPVKRESWVCQIHWSGWEQSAMEKPQNSCRHIRAIWRKSLEEGVEVIDGLVTE